jgi:hypothetical protein
MTNRADRGRLTGQSILETVVGIIFLIPIVLFLLDIAVLVLANTANDTMAKNAARAAASATDSSSGQPIGTAASALTAAQRVVENQSVSPIIPGAKLEKIIYVDNAGAHSLAGQPNSRNTQNPDAATDPVVNLPPGTGQVAAVTTMLVRAPVPFPGFFTTKTFVARAVEPIVSLPP